MCYKKPVKNLYSVYFSYVLHFLKAKTSIEFILHIKCITFCPMDVFLKYYDVTRICLQGVEIFYIKNFCATFPKKENFIVYILQRQRAKKKSRKIKFDRRILNISANKSKKQKITKLCTERN